MRSPKLDSWQTMQRDFRSYPPTQRPRWQVQGEAIVRNNVVFGGAQPAFASHHHQGQPRNLEVVHNTFVATSGDAAVLGHWADHPGMVRANNALYSESGRALTFLNGANGVRLPVADRCSPRPARKRATRRRRAARRRRS